MYTYIREAIKAHNVQRCIYRQRGAFGPCQTESIVIIGIAIAALLKACYSNDTNPTFGVCIADMTSKSLLYLPFVSWESKEGNAAQRTVCASFSGAVVPSPVRICHPDSEVQSQGTFQLPGGRSARNETSKTYTRTTNRM